MDPSTFESRTPIASPLTPDDTLIVARHADFASAARRLPLPDTVRPGAINWPYLATIVGVHAASLAALVPWTFSWTGLVVSLVGVHLFGQAINLCYHRVLAHRSAMLPRWLEHAFVVMAICCFQDTPGKWVAMHRIHHKHSDDQPDPHSPLVGFLWSHVGWLLVRNEGTHSVAAYQKYASDILRDKFYMSLEKSYKWLWIWIGHVALFSLFGIAIGAMTTGSWRGALHMAVSLVVWGVFVRTVLVWHITWSVNSLTHLFGYASYPTDDHSRNNWLVALFTVGEGWHNNHHHDPVSASNQRRWWEFDITYYQIRLLERVGLAERVMRPRHVRHEDRTDLGARVFSATPPLDSASQCDSPPTPQGGGGSGACPHTKHPTRDDAAATPIRQQLAAQHRENDMKRRRPRYSALQTRAVLSIVAFTLIAMGAIAFGALQIDSVEDLVWPPVYVEARAPADFELRKILLDHRDAAWAGEGAVATARVHALLSREAYGRANAVHQAWMRHRDGITGLVRHSPDRAVWTYRDVGADLFGHKLNAALLLDSEHARALLDTLDAERTISGPQGLCREADTRSGNPRAGQGLRSQMFASSEYVKDGLLPVLEMHGHPAVLSRIAEICDAILDHSEHQSRFGVIPDKRSEVNGEMLQVLGRLYYATRTERYADMAARIADAAVMQMLPNNHGLPAKEYNYYSDDAVRPFVQIRDHGNELMVGLSEAYAMAVDRGASGDVAWAERADRWAEPLTRMYELLLEHGRNADGLIVNQLDAASLALLDAQASDNWGYVLCGTELFVQAAERHGSIDIGRLATLRTQIASTIEAVLRTDGLAWEGTHQDGYADSIESALYAAAYFEGVDRRRINRWVDRQIAAMFHKQRSDGFVDEHYLDGNFIRTSLLYGKMRSGGWVPDPWSPGVGVGYERVDDGRAIVVVQTNDQAWSGRIVPDMERHGQIMQLPWNWPRINSWPEWCPAERVASISVLSGDLHVVLPAAGEIASGIQCNLPAHSMAAFEIQIQSP